MSTEPEDPQLSFLGAWMMGLVDADAIDEHINRWHDSGDGVTRCLHEYLGMSWEQYKTWVETGRLPNRLAA